MKSILDPTFHYVPSAETDLRKTFARVRREMARARAQPQAASGVGRVVAFSRKSAAAR